MKLLLLLLTIMIAFALSGCGSFKAKRVDAEESDEKAMEITDKWVDGDTVRIVQDTLKMIAKHRGFKRYLGKHQGVPTVFVADVQNNTSEAYFPVEELNDELLNEISSSGDFTLVDAAARERLLKEITYQNNGMVDPRTAKSIGKQTGADLMIFGNVHMKPRTRSGKTIKQYSVNLRMTDVEKGVEVLRTRAKLSKFSKKSSVGW